ncbi:MAG: glycoside hydrolase domain-containing protein [Anaerolineales bacterium]
MRTPSTAVRGVFVLLMILGVVFLSNIEIVQSGAGQQAGAGSIDQGRVLLDVPTPTAVPTETPNLPIYFPVIQNNYGFLYSSVVIAQGQGFDNCKPLSVEGMQNWWDNSPYSAVNIYLGGISALCPFDELGFEWYSQVADQGWSFILTWAGPQSPQGCPQNCKFRHPMSTDPEIAYLEGMIEALSAVEKAIQLGFKGQLVLYYDLESYSGADEATRAVVASFIQGWTEELHELGHIAGAYGAACTSYVVDWAFNDPPLDEIWIAKWNKEYAYDPDASVYDTICLDIEGQPPIFWTNHQRLKQYTGPHNETWGNLTVKIDSDVLDGKVNALFGQPPEKDFQPANAIQNSAPVVSPISDALSGMQMLTASTGWVLRGDQLLWTADGGSTWQDISPINTSQGELLGVHFLNADQGWVAARQIGENGAISISVHQTNDGGSEWSEATINEFSASEVMEIESAWFEFLDQQVGWLALQLSSGGNFSFGRLLATGDGGRTWQERELPLGEPVEFKDAQHGWTTGGPLDQVYTTEDGGRTWQLSDNLPGGEMTGLLSSEEQPLAGELPQGTVQFETGAGQTGWVLVQDGNCSGYKPRAGESLPAGEAPLQCVSSSRLLTTMDGGISWREITPTDD